MLNNFSFNFTSKCSEPLASFVLLDSQGLNLTFWDSMQDDRYRAYFANLDSFVTKQLESRLWKSYAINPRLEPRKTFFLTRLIFDSTKEIRESFMHSIRNILLDLRMYFKVFSSKMLVIIKLPKSLASAFVSLFRDVKKLIVDCLSNLERINNSFFMFIRRIQSIFIHLNDHIGDIYV